MTDDAEDESTEAAEWLPVAQALELSCFTIQQLRALVSAGIVRTKRVSGLLAYCREDLQRFDGMPRNTEPDEQGSLLAEFRAVSEGYKSMLELALRQTKQAQDHERLLVTAFSKPLNDLGDSQKNLVTAVLDQNKQLVERATAGDHARLEFVKGAESMLRDQRVEMREQLELDRKQALRLEMWDGVKKAAPMLLEGFRKTTGLDRLEAAKRLKAKLDPAKVAALIKLELIDDAEATDLCIALELDRKELDRMNAEADAEEAKAAAPEAEQKPEAAE